MPDPAVVIAMREFKAGLLAREDGQMREMAAHWLTVERSLAELIENLATDFNAKLQAGETISASALYRMERYKRLRGQARDQFAEYAAWANGSLTTYQEGSIRLGLDHSAQAIQLSYWPDSTGVYFDRLPVEAVINQAGIAGNGRPLGELLRNRMVTQDADVWQRLVDNLVRGTALGRNPRDVARDMRNDLAGGLNKALTIARTEGLRPYREVSRSQYEHSGVVIGQKRLSAHDGRVCAACIADDGAVYSLNEVISDHPNGRCTSVPIVRGMPETTWTNGETWFRQQPEDTQLSILGRGRLDAYQSGAFEFRDLVRRTDNPTWGAGLTPRPLADLLGGARDPGPPPVDLRGPPTRGPRPPSTDEDRLQGEIDQLEPMVNDMIRGGDPTAGGMKSYLDGTRAELERQRQLNQALWDNLGLAPDQATDRDWRALADQLTEEGRALYDKYTKDGIKSFVAQERGAQDAGYAVVGKEQILVRRGAFSIREAQRYEGELWAEAKEDLSSAMGELLQRAGYRPGDIAQADFAQRTRLLEELGNKELRTTGSGRISNIDKVPVDARGRVVDQVDFDLAAVCGNSAIDPLALPTLDAYGKMELADLIRSTRLNERQEGYISELNF